MYNSYVDLYNIQYTYTYKSTEKHITIKVTIKLKKERNKNRNIYVQWNEWQSKKNRKTKTTTEIKNDNNALVKRNASGNDGDFLFHPNNMIWSVSVCQSKNDNNVKEKLLRIYTCIGKRVNRKFK